jgi:hypothetical protein
MRPAMAPRKSLRQARSIAGKQKEKLTVKNNFLFLRMIRHR